MNEPHVVALHYAVEHHNSVNYQNASPVRHETPKFHLTLEDDSARFELKEHFADEDEARKTVEPFIKHCEFEVGLRNGPGQFKLRYERPEIVDRNPSPPESTSTPGTRNLRASLVLPAPTFTASVTLVSPRYPSPPSGGEVDANDPDVETMYRRYERYRLGREPLPTMAFFCLTVLESKFQSRQNAARKCRIDVQILHTIGELTDKKGGDEARKAKGSGKDLTRQEKRFLKKAIEETIFRAAQVAADESQCLPTITLATLPSLRE